MDNDMSKRLTFNVSHRDIFSKARRGLLNITRPDGKRVQVVSPGILVYTSRGSVPHLTPDVVDNIRSQNPNAISAISMSIDHFMDLDIPSATLYPHGIATYTGFERPIHLKQPEDIPSPFLLFGIRDPARDAGDKLPLHSEMENNITKPIYRLSPNTDKQVFMKIIRGTVPLSPSSYYNYINALKPDAYSSLEDEIIPTTNDFGESCLSRKRLERAATRTMKWLSEAIKVNNGGHAIFAPVIPVHDQIPLHLWFCKNLLELKDHISGFILSDAKVPEIIEKSAPEKPLVHMFYDQLPTPSDYLAGIAEGIDLFGSGILKITSDRGYAMTFSLDADGGELGFSLWDRPPDEDMFKPIQEGCECFSCTMTEKTLPGLETLLPKFSRIFLNHLLLAHEMLVHVLIQIHNVHVMETFLEDVRRSIQEGTFSEKKDKFAASYSSKWNGLDKVGKWK